MMRAAAFKIFLLSTLLLSFSWAVLPSVARAQEAKPDSGKPEPTPTPAKKSGKGSKKKAVQPDIADFKTEDMTEGKGKEALKGKTIKVNYSGWLYDPAGTKDHGKLFSSSNNGADPAVFTLGSGAMIKGWDEGIVGMKVGGKRTLLVPSSMGYGARGAGDGQIPAGAGLVFEIELLDVMDNAPSATPSVN